jgi:3-methyladenine DNA glycosylase AlkD
MHRISQIKDAVKAAAAVSKVGVEMFFKTGSGSYSEHDQFIGVSVPRLRKIAKDFSDLPLEEIKILMESKINEERLLALIILVNQYKKATDEVKSQIYAFYVNNLRCVNNWNLVDASAHHIMGAHLHGEDVDVLMNLARSEVLWERRVSIVATWYFIRQGDVDHTFAIAEILLQDHHDLIHKATGWMLREAGKRDVQKLIMFLDKHSAKMPRTMLRYAIEKFDANVRSGYLRN